MSKFNAFKVRLLGRVQRRFRVSRPGSVLILCVALLVLLALIGTAMISTTRIDRYSAVQNTTNTQVDLLMEGMKQVATSAILGDLWNNGTITNTTVNNGYRRCLRTTVAAIPTTDGFDHWDMPAVNGIASTVAGTNPPQYDPSLAPRLSGL